DWFACDLAHLKQATSVTGVRRALLFTGDDVASPPVSWETVPTPAMAPFHAEQRIALPAQIDGISVAAAASGFVELSIGASTATVPRHWLARMLFRLPLHDFALGYLETYEGFFYDDRDGFTLGLRGGERVVFDRDGITQAVAKL